MLDMFEASPIFEANRKTFRQVCQTCLKEKPLHSQTYPSVCQEMPVQVLSCKRPLRFAHIRYVNMVTFLYITYELKILVNFIKFHFIQK